MHIVEAFINPGQILLLTNEMPAANNLLSWSPDFANSQSTFWTLLHHHLRAETSEPPKWVSKLL
jgi:hypothetical protein